MRATFLAAAILVVASVGASAAADEFDELVKLQSQVHSLVEAGKFKEAVPLAEELAARAKKSLTDQPEALASCLNDLANVYDEQGLYAEAEPAFQELLAVAQKHFSPTDERIADYLNNLGNLYRHVHRFADAEPLFKRSLAIREQAAGPQSPRLAATLNNLATLYSDQSRYAEAEALYKRAMAIDEKLYGRQHMETAGCLNNLAIVYAAQGRFAEAESLYSEAGAIRLKVLGPEHPLVADSLNNVAIVYSNQQRYAEAEPLYRRALAIQRKALGSEHPLVARGLLNLAETLSGERQYEQAESLYQQALATLERIAGPDHPEVAATLHNLADLYKSQGRYAEAEKFAERAATLFEKRCPSPRMRYSCYRGRAEIRWQLGKRQEAVNDLRHAMDFAERTRAEASASEKQRADIFTRYTTAYELMLDWQNELGQPAEALAASERSRARSLMDQMAAANIDMLAGLPETEANGLRKREVDAKTHLAELEKEAEHSGVDERMAGELVRAEQEVADSYDAIRNANPAYRQMLGSNFRPPAIEEIQRAIVGEQGLLLEYYLGFDHGYVVVVPAPGVAPRIESLVLDEKQSQALGVKPGPLTGVLMHEMLNGAGTAGRSGSANARGLQLDTSEASAPAAAAILPLLRRPASALKTIDKLAVLWEVLIPKAEREAIVSGKIKRLVVVPDGALAPLPFEALVVAPDAEPKYLLDVGPPIITVPSATLLFNLATKQTTAGRGPRSVLSVGNANYGPVASNTASGQAAPEPLSARYAALRGRLKQLPFTGLECTRVASDFKAHGLEAGILQKDAAREASVRIYAPGCRTLHFACHGLIDQRHGNLFGALALTPGPNPAAAEDDGFLTLAEIYTLDLHACDLAILSACDTNYGPQEWGEGVWSLSRGFLVAGARRVVASNWLVDDEAAANLVSGFCSVVAQGQAAKSIDYAQALHDAKLQIRQQAKWSSPYFWATFVLIGPP